MKANPKPLLFFQTVADFQGSVVSSLLYGLTQAQNLHLGLWLLRPFE